MDPFTMIAEETASELLGVSMNRSRHHHLLDGDDELHYVGKEVDDDDPFVASNQAAMSYNRSSLCCSKPLTEGLPQGVSYLDTKCNRYPNLDDVPHSTNN